MVKTYEEGLRDGAIQALENTQGEHKDRLDSHSERLARIEKIMYIGIGGLAFLQAVPLIQQTLNSFG